MDKANHVSNRRAVSSVVRARVPLARIKAHALARSKSGQPVQQDDDEAQRVSFGAIPRSANVVVLSWPKL